MDAKTLPGAMPGNLPEGARPPEDFKPDLVAKDLMRRTRAGALGTIDRNTGHPMTTLVTIATDFDGAPIILVSSLSSHTANLAADGRASVLMAQTGKGDPLAHPRVTLMGAFARVEDGAERTRLKRRFLARHPKAQIYADFGDFGFWRMTVASAHLNGGFARAADLPAVEVLTDVSRAGDLIAAEPSAIDHMNDDHPEAVALYATALAGEEAGPWRMTGADPDGLDLMANERTARIAFPAPILTGEALHRALVAMARDARSAAG